MKPRGTSDVRQTPQVRIAKTQESKYSVWEGAAALASLRSFMPQWVNRAEYEGVWALAFLMPRRLASLCCILTAIGFGRHGAFRVSAGSV